MVNMNDFLILIDKNKFFKNVKHVFNAEKAKKKKLKKKLYEKKIVPSVLSDFIKF